MMFGPPLQACGLDWDDMSVLQDPQLQVVEDIFAALGLAIAPETSEIHHACQVVEVAVMSLETHPELKPLAHALEWVFSMSGNSLVDCTQTILDEMIYDQWDWSPEHLTFLAELHAEAEMILASAQEGLTLLAETPQLLEQLMQNLQQLMRHLPRRKQHVERHHLTPYTRWCQWTDHLAPTSERTTPTDAEIL
jgi:hypothetical protein